MNMINLSIEGSIGKIFLNRPEKYNSFNRQMSLELQEAIETCAKDEKIRAVYLSATGKAFSAGQDLGEAVEPSMSIQKIVEEHYNPIILGIRNMEKPVVCAVNGIAAGAGANIALACDIVVAAKSATFIQAFSKIGLIPDSGGTFMLPRLIGLQRASALMMLGEKVSADEAYEMGMIYKVYNDDTFENESLMLAVTLSQLPTTGLGLTKKLLNESFQNNLETQLKREGQLQVTAAQTKDFRDAVEAFLAKKLVKK